MSERDPKTIREELVEIRTELKWVKWLAAGALMASTVGQITRLGSVPQALIGWLL
jgi:hypothetical protein